jgi:hypothetical protein
MARTFAVAAVGALVAEGAGEGNGVGYADQNDTAEPSDHVALGTEAAGNARLSLKRFKRKLEASRKAEITPRSNEEYIGRYRDGKRG